MKLSSQVLRCALLALALVASVLATNVLAPVISVSYAKENTGGSTSGAAIASSPEFLDEQREEIAAIAVDTDVLEARMRANDESDTILLDTRISLEALSRNLATSTAALRPRLATINQRLEEIGQGAASGDPAEPQALSEERQNLTAQKAAINALLGEVDAVSLRISRLIEEVAQIRRVLFTNTLSRRYDISVAVSPMVIGEFASEINEVYSAFSSWLRFVISYKLPSTLLVTFFAFAGALVLLIGGRRLFGDTLHADPDRVDPSYLNRLSVAFWTTLLPSAALVVFLGATWFFYNYLDVLRHDVSEIMIALFNVVAIVFFVHRLAMAVLSPSLPAWRLVPVQTRPARTLLWLVSLTALVTGLDYFAGRINEIMNSPLSLTVAKSFFATLLVGLLVIVISFVRPYLDQAGRPKHWHPLFRTITFLLGAATVLAAILGYIGFASFLAQQIVVSGAILATMYIGYCSASAIAEEGAFARTSLGRSLSKRFNLDETHQEQFGLASSLVINLLVLVIGVPLILLQWGFQWGDIHAWIYKLATEVRIGSITFSLVSILSGIVFFFIAYFGMRAFRRWLDGKVMARGRVDAGVRNSISTAIGYAGVGIAALIGISAAGIDLSSLALVAGALSLGIGFGLQNIVNNFVSGLILLAERPFKVGDWIVAGTTEGFVRKISVRATEIETFRRQTVILPNSELINAAVGNWTLRNKLGRIEIPVSVAYHSDARQVYDILLEIVRGIPQVLRNPEPSVLLTGFGEAALNFEIRAFMPDITATLGTQTEIRQRIVERFKAEGIDMPLPPRDLTIRGLPEVLAKAGGTETSEAEDSEADDRAEAASKK